MPSIKPVLHPLKTPQPMLFPSELQGNPDTGSSLSGSSSARPGDEALCTPITPPAAYTEFLKAFTPIFSPDSARGENGRFRFDKPFERSSSSYLAALANNHPTSNPIAGGNGNSNGNGTGNASAPTSQPASAVSTSFNFNEHPRSATATTTASLPPPTPYGAPFPRRDPRNLRSLRIPPSAGQAQAQSLGPLPPRYSPTPPAGMAAMMGEPFSSPSASTPRSATMLRSPYSPSDWKLRYYEGPRSASGAVSAGGRVSVRHVVTHTVTYKRTQLEDPPKGKKRRKISSEKEKVAEKESEKEDDDERKGQEEEEEEEAGDEQSSASSSGSDEEEDA